MAVSFSVRGRDVGSAVAEAQAQVACNVPRVDGYSIKWAGEFQSAYQAAERLAVVVPLTIGLIFLLLTLLYVRLREGILVLGTVLITSPVGGMVALWITGTNFSVSSAVGFLTLFGVSVQTGVILISYMNDRRAEGLSIDESILQACDMRLRPVLMTALVASLRCGERPKLASQIFSPGFPRQHAICLSGELRKPGSELIPIEIHATRITHRTLCVFAKSLSQYTFVSKEHQGTDPAVPPSLATLEDRSRRILDSFSGNPSPHERRFRPRHD